MGSKKDFEKFFKDEKEKMKKQFGLESVLSQTLWDGQIDDENFNEVFSSIIYLMKKCIEDKYYKEQLYEISLENYKSTKD